MKKLMYLLCLGLVVTVPAWSATITMSGSDASGSSSFINGTNWTGGAAPSAGNDYITGDFTLRTPGDAGSYTFAGDSLTINNNSAYSKGLLFKGTGTTAASTITINNLILDKGLIAHANASSQLFNLYGNINVVGDSTLYPKQGPINIYSVISGTSKITVQASDNNSGNKVRIYSSANTYTGNIVNNGRFELVDNANLNFVIGASGVNNGISNGSAGTQQHSIFNGDFVFDLTNAGTTVGDSWTIISTVAASTYYYDTFTVAGFLDKGDKKWWKNANNAWYEFDEATGKLAVIPEPATLVLLGLGAVILRKRK